MNLNVEIPDDLARRLGAAGGDLSRRALEGFAVEEYRAGRGDQGGTATLARLRYPL